MPRSRGSYRSQGSGHHSSQGSHRMETHRHHHPPGGWFDEDYAPCSTYTGHPNMYPLPMQSASPAQAFLPPESPYQYQQAHAHQQFHMQQAQMQQAQMQQAAQLQQLQMRQSQAHRSIQRHIEGRPEQSQTQHFEEPYQDCSDLLRSAHLGSIWSWLRVTKMFQNRSPSSRRPWSQILSGFCFRPPRNTEKGTVAGFSCDASNLLN